MDDFAELVNEHQSMVFRTLARLTGEREELEDLAQEVFLRLFRALPNFRGQAKLSTFLYRIIVNVVNDEWSRRRTARRMGPIGDEALDVASTAPGPRELVERDGFQDALDAALGQLKLADRTILTLHYQEGRSYEEIARILDVPMGTVKTNLHRARERLKNIMKEWTCPCQVKS